MNYAFVASGVVTEIITPVDGTTLEEQFHPDFLKSLVQCNDGVQQGWLYSDGAFTAPPVAVVNKADLVAYTAGKRFLLETGGFSFMSRDISTDRDSQSKIGNVALAANIVGPSFSTSFKCSDGSFFTLNQEDALSMAKAVMNFVSGCFDAESAIGAAISSGSITTSAEIDAASWPTNVVG
ncbi:DUF4376 domain-containing protein [Rhizobium sp. A37_96]